MSEKIDVHKIAQLARLQLKPEEEQELQKKFQEILEYFNIISDVDTSFTMKGKDESLQRIFREDKPQKSDIQPEKFSPYVENHFFKVPQIIE